VSKVSCWVSRLASLRGDEISYAAAVSRSNALTNDTARLPSAAASCASHKRPVSHIGLPQGGCEDHVHATWAA